MKRFFQIFKPVTNSIIVMKKCLIFLMILSFIACDGGYNFETIARYQAEGSNLTADLTTVGFVLEGDDLGEGDAKGTLSSLKFSDTIYFHTNTKQLLALTYKKDSIQISNPYDMTMSLMYCLDSIGYVEYNKEELRELVDVIQATAYGPKGTYLNGQTDLIKVVSVDFKTY